MIIVLTLYLFIVVIFSMTNFNGQDPAASTIDLSGDITIGGQLTAEGGLLLPDGKDSAPSLAFILDTKTGIERSGTSEMSFVSNGSKRLKVGSTSITDLVPLLIPDGTPSAPSIAFTSDTTTGIYKDPTQTSVALSYQNNLVAAFSSALAKIKSNEMRIINSDTTEYKIQPGGSAVITYLTGTPLTNFSTSEMTFYTPDFTILNGSDSTFFEILPAAGLIKAQVNSNTLFQTIGPPGSAIVQWSGAQVGTDITFTNGTFTNCTCTNLTSTNLTSTAITTQTIQTNSIVSSLQPFGIWTFSAYSVPVATIATSGTTIVSVPYPTVALAPVGAAITYSAGVFTLQPGDYEVEVTNNWTPTTTNNLRLHRIIFNGTIWQNTTTTQGVVGTGNFGCTIMTHSLLHASSPSTLSVDLQNQSTVLVWLIDLGRISIRKLG